MKLAFSTLSCPSWTLERAVTAAREYGYSAIELRLIDDQTLTPALLRANLERVRRAFAGSGIAICGLGSSARLADNAPERAPHEQELRELIPMAKSLGVPMIRVFGGNRPAGADEARGITNVAAGLSTVAPMAEDAGVSLLLETHDDFCRSEVVARVMAQAPSPAVGVIWDSHHPFRHGDSIALTWKNLAPRLKHVHIKDARKSPTGKASGWDLVLLGEGEVPVREMLQTLKANGYDGYVSVEWEKRWHPDIPDPEIALPQHMAKLREWGLPTR